MHALAGELRPFVTGRAASVHQVFSGPISGDAILLLSYEGAVKLSNLFVEEHLRSERLDSSTSEILTEDREIHAAKRMPRHVRQSSPGARNVFRTPAAPGFDRTLSDFALDRAATNCDMQLSLPRHSIFSPRESMDGL